MNLTDVTKVREQKCFWEMCMHKNVLYKENGDSVEWVTSIRNRVIPYNYTDWNSHFNSNPNQISNYKIALDNFSLWRNNEQNIFALLHSCTNRWLHSLDCTLPQSLIANNSKRNVSGLHIQSNQSGYLQFLPVMVANNRNVISLFKLQTKGR